MVVVGDESNGFDLGLFQGLKISSGMLSDLWEQRNRTRQKNRACQTRLPAGREELERR